MGSLDDQLPDEEAFSSWEFGGLDDAQPVLLMRVRLDADGVVRFGSEKLATRRWVKREARWRDREKKEHQSSWWRMEVRAPAEERTVGRGDTLLLRRYPLSHQQAESALFKRGSRKPRNHRPDVANTAFASEVEMIRWIEALPHDYWENGSHFVAGVSLPSGGLDASTRRSRNASGGYVFGISAHSPEKLAESMLTSEAARELLRWTQDGTLRFWPKLASVKMERLPRLTQDERERAPTLLHLAIRMALAGPEEEGEAWSERPAMDLADRLYRQLVHLNHQRERPRHTFLPPEEL